MVCCCSSLGWSHCQPWQCHDCTGLWCSGPAGGLASWPQAGDSRSTGLAAPGQLVLTDGVAALREVEPWKQKRRSQSSRDLLSLREAGEGRLLEMPLPPAALQSPKAACPPPPSLAGCFPSCSALLQGPTQPCPLPAEARGEEGTAPSHTNPELSSFCHPLCHNRFLSHTRCFLCVWQLHPRRVTVGERDGMEEPQPP